MVIYCNMLVSRGLRAQGSLLAYAKVLSCLIQAGVSQCACWSSWWPCQGVVPGSCDDASLACQGLLLLKNCRLAGVFGSCCHLQAQMNLEGCLGCSGSELAAWPRKFLVGLCQGNHTGSCAVSHAPIPHELRRFQFQAVVASYGCLAEVSNF